MFAIFTNLQSFTTKRGVTVADPGFPTKAPTLGWTPTLDGANLLFGLFFAENYIKFKKMD